MVQGTKLLKMSEQFTKQFKLRLPIIQAPMAGVTKSSMVIASCKAGIIGSLGAGMMKPDDISQAIREIRDGVNGAPFNINLFVIHHYPEGYQWKKSDVEWLRKYYEEKDFGPFPNPTSFAPAFEDQFEALLQEAPPIASFTFGILTFDQVKACHDRGIKVIGTATNVEEAIQWEKIGADLICAQGCEAGGHRGNFIDLEAPGTGLFSLIPEVVGLVKLPVIASGGIMDGKGIVAAKILGASAVQLGTAFLASPEAALPAAYKEALVKGKHSHDTTLIKAFSGRFARGIKNEFSEHSKDKPILPYPVQNALTQPLRKNSTERGDSEHISLWAGQGINKIREDSIQGICDRLEQEIRQVTD